jgi:putative PIN family toxin of toxin-antitoxin system
MTSKAVLDTNILVPGLGNPSGAPAKLLDRWFDGQFVLLTSKPIFEEYSRILLNHPIVPRDKAEVFLNGLAELAQVISISEKLNVCKDPSDNIFLETAATGNAKYLVTKNIKHFPFKRYQEVEIVRVSKFLSQLEKEFG